MKAEEFVSSSNVSAFILAALALVVTASIAGGYMNLVSGLTLVVNLLMALILLSINARLGTKAAKKR
ncbi:MAG: hypothetical protein HYS81_03485 [Candidatus Aenigmatarchaeota archaeon]|nr:MAG: hypothetical protein HYS81_03485 [Candidatus Aenigmarchaeota archaeon]